MEHHSPSYISLPTYQPDFNGLYQLWISSVNAANELDLLKNDLDQVRKELQDAEVELRRLENESSSLFDALHAQKNIFSSLLTSKSEREQESERRERARKDFKRVFSEKARFTSSVDALKTKLVRMDQSQRSLSSCASLSNELWLKLSETTEARTSAMGALAATVGENMESLSASESSLEVATKLASDSTRARQCIQHAHHYYSLALRATDGLRPASSGSRLAEGFAGDLVNMNRQSEYRGAISQASKAQVCLDEFFRVMAPYPYTIPQDRMLDYNTLKKDGVQQVTAIYGLIYCGSSSTTGVRKSVQTLIDKQEATFELLTRLAVHVQEAVPMYVRDERVARASRDEARKKLANRWRGAQSTNL